MHDRLRPRDPASGEHAGKYLINTHPRNWKPAGEGPEYENAWALGPDVGVGDLDAVHESQLALQRPRHGSDLDGRIVAAAMEIYERGVIGNCRRRDPLEFGSAEALVRHGRGNRLSRRLRQRDRRGLQTHGREARAPRSVHGRQRAGIPGLRSARLPGNGDCLRDVQPWRVPPPRVDAGDRIIGAWDPHTPSGKSEWVVHEQIEPPRTTTPERASSSAAPADRSSLFVPCTVAARGISYSIDDFVRIGERTWNIERLFNLAAGLGKADDTLPKRLLAEPHKSGPSAGVVVNLGAMLPVYYRERGWSEDGVPTREKLVKLGLESA